MGWLEYFELSLSFVADWLDICSIKVNQSGLAVISEREREREARGTYIHTGREGNRNRGGDGKGQSCRERLIERIIGKC